MQANVFLCVSEQLLWTFMLFLQSEEQRYIEQLVYVRCVYMFVSRVALIADAVSLITNP